MIYPFSNRISGCLLTALALMQLVPELKAIVPGAKVPRSAETQSAANPNPTVFPPFSSPHGHTYAEWNEKWWKFVLALPVNQNPILGADCSIGQSGPVWFLVGGPPTINCAVPAGKSLFFPIVNAECSTLELDPFFGATPAERAACAKSFMDGATGLTATIDGVSIQNLMAYQSASSDFDFTVPDHNILFVPGLGAASGKSSANGFYLMLAPLSAGAHTIHFAGMAGIPGNPSSPFTIDTTYSLTVGR